jgi:phosphoadenosine phosphosulfate reductase
MSDLAERPDAAALANRYGGLDGVDLLRPLIRDVFRGRIALVSSFGTESAVLLDLVAQVDPATPVLVLDTGQLFEETRRYWQVLEARLGLRDLRVIEPEPVRLAAEDPDKELWYFDPDRCCVLRKVEPLARGLVPFAAWITGRKRFQGGLRGELPVIEPDTEGRVKVNPLARWTPERIEAQFAARGLPRHPLKAQGYRSIGCLPCTDRTRPGEDPRAGRWRHQGKTECGIHRPAAAPISSL